jgi:hypothetical protein
MDARTLRRLGERAAALPAAPLIRVLLVTALVLGAAACGGGDGGGDAASGDAETKTHKIAEHGFQVSLPADWRTISPSQALSPEEMREIREQNPEISRYLDAVTGPDSPIKFFAFDPDAVDGFATNLNVIVLPVGEAVSLDEPVEAARTELERLPTRTSEVEEERLELPAGEAVRLRYRQTIETDNGKQELATTQYSTVAGGTSYILTFTTLPEQLDELDPLFRASAESFRTTG